MDLSVVIPTYRSAAQLAELVDQLISSLQCLEIEFEIILVDDGSGDQTWLTMAELQQLHPEYLTTIRLEHRRGQQWATICGLDHAQGQVIATMDDDLQHPPDELVRLYRCACQCDIELVYGLYIPNQPDFRRLLGLTARAILCDRCDMPLNPTAFRVIQRPLVTRVLEEPIAANPVVDLLIAKRATKFGGLVVRHDRRKSGRSTYTIWSLLRLTFASFTMRKQRPVPTLPRGERGYQIAEILAHHGHSLFVGQPDSRAD